VRHTAHKVRDCKKKQDWLNNVSKGGSQQKTGGKRKEVENRITEVDEASEAENKVMSEGLRGRPHIMAGRELETWTG
jgi:hypothetical protein